MEGLPIGSYKHFDIVYLVFSVVEGWTFTRLSEWAAQIKAHAPNAYVYVIGNKIDEARRVISSEQGQEFAETHGFQYRESSSAQPDILKSVIDRSVREVVAKKRSAEQAPSPLQKLLPDKEKCRIM